MDWMPTLARSLQKAQHQRRPRAAAIFMTALSFSLTCLPGCFTSGLISCSCLSLAVPSSGFPYQIFCSRTTAAPSLQSSPLIHTTDILAHVSSPLALPLSLCALSHFSIEWLCMRPCAEHAFNSTNKQRRSRNGLKILMQENTTVFG